MFELAFITQNIYFRSNAAVGRRTSGQPTCGKLKAVEEKLNGILKEIAPSAWPTAVETWVLPSDIIWSADQQNSKVVG